MFPFHRPFPRGSQSSCAAIEECEREAGTQSSRMTHAIRSRVIATHSGSRSLATTRRPARKAAAGIEPEPQKESGRQVG